MPIRSRSTIPWLFCILGAGCANLGEGLTRAALPPEAPAVEEILADLEANDAAITSFRAAGTFTLESPETDAVQKFRRGRILFRRPADLYVQGNHNVTNIPIFKLVCVGKEFVLEFPAAAKHNYYSLSGEEFDDVPFPVSPSDITREVFLPEDWGALGRREARVVDYDVKRGVAVVAIGKKGRPRRRIEVALMDGPEASSWVVVRNEGLGEDGEPISVTLSTDYRMTDGIRFPARVETRFPTESTRMVFAFRNVRLNVDLPDETFDVGARARELRLHASPAAEGGRDER